MSPSDNKQSQKFLHWSQRQQAWLESQIKSAEKLKSILEQNEIDNEIGTEIRNHEKQNEQLNTLIEEYEILQREIRTEIIQDKNNQEIVRLIKELIQTLIKINEEIFQIILKQKENLQKEMNNFFPLKNRFERYNPQDKSSSENVDYDV